jgi:hypothetical protein
MLTFEQYQETMTGCTEITYEELDTLLEMYEKLDEGRYSEFTANHDMHTAVKAADAEHAEMRAKLAKKSAAPEAPKMETKTYVHIKKADGSLHKSYDMSKPEHRADLLKNRAKHQADGHKIEMKKVSVPVKTAVHRPGLH